MFIRCTGPVVLSVLGLAAAYAGGGAPKGASAELQGTWKLVALEANGEVQDGAVLGQPHWRIQGNKVHRAGQDLAILTTDPKATPKVIDLKMLRPDRVLEGIYGVDRDTLKICVNVQTDGVKERPLKLATKDQPQWRMLVFRRVQAGDEDAVGSGFVGIAIRIDREKSQVSVAQVFKDSPAEKAGLKKDDIVLQVGTTAATDLRATVDAVRQTKPGGKVTLRIKREGKEKEITIQAGVMPFLLLD
jgi:uncharacterized protein (TIGR03067 family)